MRYARSIYCAITIGIVSDPIIISTTVMYTALFRLLSANTLLFILFNLFVFISLT